MQCLPKKRRRTRVERLKAGLEALRDEKGKAEGMAAIARCASLHIHCYPMAHRIHENNIIDHIMSLFSSHDVFSHSCILYCLRVTDLLRISLQESGV